MRREPTAAEATLWGELRAGRLAGFKFRRQHPVANYIADFICTAQRLIVEIDGDVHADEAQARHDEEREKYLIARGYHVLRFTNDNVRHNLSGVLEAILEACRGAAPSPNPPPGGGRAPIPLPDGEGLGEGAGHHKPAPNWQPALYDTKHAFVAKYGEALLDLLAPKRSERILDLGCGTGDLAQKIADCGATVIGLDSSLDMIAAARAKYPALQFVPGDVTNFAFDEPFDAAFSNATLHWVKPPEDAARCIAGTLRSGGRFVAEFGGAGNVAHISAALHEAHIALTGAPLQHNWYFPSVGEYAPILEAHGFEVQAAWLFDRPTPLEGEDGMRNWLSMFGHPILRGAPTDVIDRVTATAERTLRETNYRDGQWFADYRRIRIVAIKI
jgi:very-short-patch-repair endonuclease/trans-aconitate methyltransferase